MLVFLEGNVEPKFQMLLALPPPPDYKVWEPTTAGVPSWWGKPWVKKMKQKRGETKTKPEPVEEGEKVEEPILQMAITLQNPAEQSPNVSPGLGEASLLGYFRNLQQDVLSTNKKEKLNLHPASRGVRPEACNIHEASNLLCIHCLKPLKHRQALSAAHSLYDTVQTAPFLSAQLKFIYR